MSINAAAHTDVFSFACVVYYLLTGQHYFEVSTPKEAFEAFASESRPGISDHEWLTPELAADPAMCREIDRLLALSTALDPSRRPQTAPHLTELLLEALGEQAPAPSSSAARLSALFGKRTLSNQQTFRFLVRSRPHDGMVIASAAWNSDAHALALSERGAWFWNGQAWRDARSLFAHLPRPPTCAAPHEAGGWLISGSGPGLWLLDERGLCDWLRAPAEEMSLCLACGRADELLAAVDVGGQSLALVGVSRGQWLFPRSLPGVARVTALRRLDADRFLFTGRRKDGSGFAAVYTPLSAEVVELESPELRAFIDVATVPERGAGLLVGSDGVTLRLEQALESAIVPGRPDLSAAAIDLVGGEWAATSGKLFRRNPDQGEPWRAVFEDPSLPTPFISILADAGYVIATTADGAIVEGRLES
jgi:hypothetical protein